MTKLHQIIAIEQGVAADASRAGDAAKTMFRDDAHLSGVTRTYQPRADDGDKLPPEGTLVQIRTHDVLQDVARRLGRLYDVTYSREEGNTRARADVKFGTHVVLADVPVGYLMFLARSLGELRDMVVRLPVLDPAFEWHWNSVSDCYSTDPYQTVRPQKVPRNHEIAPATKEHPAQVQVFMEDKPVGDWTTTKFSGAMKAADVKAMLHRIDQLIEAVKFAREEANSVEAASANPGETILSYVLGSDTSTA